MYEYISGELKFIYNDYIVIDNGGIGYKIFTSNNTLFNVTVGDFYTIYTDYIVKEDYVALFGFKTMDELSMFKLLVSVNSIGPKVACGILSGMEVSTLDSGKDLEKRELVSDALINLGFMKNDIERFLSSINIDEMEIEDIIKLSMKKL